MWLRKAMVYLGLGDDAEYEDYDDGYGGPEPMDRQPTQESPVSANRGGPSSSHSTMGQVASVPGAEESSAIGAVRPISGRAESSGVVTSSAGGGEDAGAVRPRPQVVRPIAMSASARPHVVVPTSFNEAQEVADKFKSGQPVVVNLQDGDRELSRRLIDFASGLCYGLGGQMERLASQVYLVTPAGVEVSDDERRRLRDRGFEA